MLFFYFLALDDPREEDKFNKIYYKYEKQIFSFIYKFFGNYYDTKEAAQDTWFAIARNISRIEMENENKLLGYLYTTAKNISYNKLKEKRNTNTVSIDAFYDISYESDLVEEIVSNENEKLLVKQILALPEIYRDVLSLYISHSMKPGQIAESLGIPLATVKSQLYRGKKILKDFIKENMLDE